MMTRRRKQTFRCNKGLGRFSKPRLERLEDRIAPGTLLDVMGMGILAASTPGEESSVVSQAIDARLQNAFSRRMADGRPHANATQPSLPELELSSDTELQFSHMDSRADRAVTSESELALNGTVPRNHPLEVQWNDVSRISSLSPSDIDKATDSSFKPHMQGFILGTGSVLLPGTAFQAGAIVIGNAAPFIPAWPSSGESGLSSGHFSVQMDAHSASGSRADIPLVGEDGELISLSGLEGDIASANDRPDAFEEHRLPKYLQNRSDDLLIGQSLDPFAVTYQKPAQEPTTGVVKSQPEYDPMRGVLFSYTQFTSVVTDMVKELTEDPNTDDIAYVVVTSAAQQNSATNAFINAGANMSKVQFFIQPMNSVWIRDYGPHFVTVDDALAIVDSHYYPTRSLDNFVPTLVGDNNFNVPTYDMGVYFSGGNFQAGPNGTGFVTALHHLDNPSADGFNTSLLSELHYRYQGIDTLHIMPQLPFSVDGTGHIDMWMYLVDEKTVIISEFLPGSNSTAISVTNNAVGYMENLGFKVYRTPAWNASGVHYTYANAFRVNNRIFVPVYGTAVKPGGNSAYNSRDTTALQVWQQAAGPGVEIIPIQCYSIIPAAGAIHCIVKQVPRYLGNTPAVNIISPAGGEILTPGTQYKVEWSAINTNNVQPSAVSIYVNYGDGEYQHLTTTADTGSYLWTLGNVVNRAENATIMVVAQSATGAKTEVISQPFSISPSRLTTYDFSSGAGVNKFAYGSATTSWTTVNLNPSPVASQLTTDNYARLATSNATGNSTDTNRYIAPTPTSSSESTHVFTFQIPTPVERMAQLEVLWEGYAASATQVELYVWDRVALNWGDGSGLSGMNRYMDSWAGNIDGELTGAIRSNFSRYVDGSGVIRFLVIADRPGAVGSTGSGITTYHDYIKLDVKQVDFTIPNRRI